jgi:hypothetical protein
MRELPPSRRPEKPHRFTVQVTISAFRPLSSEPRVMTGWPGNLFSIAADPVADARTVPSCVWSISTMNVAKSVLSSSRLVMTTLRKCPDAPRVPGWSPASSLNGSWLPSAPSVIVHESVALAGAV